MNRKKLASLVLAVSSLSAMDALALGLGELRLESFLNEPLNARVNLLDAGDLSADQLRVRLATGEDFDRLGVDRAYFLTTIRFEVELDSNGGGHITITSDQPVLEPFLDFIVEARWPSGRLLREYTVLVDPPAFQSGTTVVSASEMSGDAPPAAEKKTTETAVVGSGTRVRTSGQSVPPTQRPSGSYAGDANSTPISGDEYLIQRNDTLWGIASRARPAQATVQQTMLEIQRMNPEAFIGGNINRIKAGYVIYLPQDSEIRAAEADAAAAVKQQNEDWRAGKAGTYVPPAASLRISGGDDVDAGAGPVAALQSEVASSQENLAAAARENDELKGRLSSMEEQIETLQRIVSLKDEQIAALQQTAADGEGIAAIEDLDALDAALGDLDGAAGEEAGMPADSAVDETAMESVESAADSMEEGARDSAGDLLADAQDTASAADESPTLSETDSGAAAKPAVRPPVVTAPQEAPGLLSMLLDNLLYIVGALLALGAAVFLFLRRRGAEVDEDDAPASVQRESDAAFDNVQLADADLQLDDADIEDDSDEDHEAGLIDEPPLVGGEDDGERGYGKKVHDGYADDVDTGDALAEADIYIAYGRYPQAIDLLKTAIESDPGNPAFRLKLVELGAETNDRGLATQQLADLRVLEDEPSISRAEEIIRGVPGGAAWLSGLPAATVAPGTQARRPAPEPTPDLDLPELELDELVSQSTPPAALSEGDPSALESSFGDLEIESDSGDIADLDLTEDFSGLDDEDIDDESMVFATEADEVSTKLDLARAYLDMGDEHGARQILEEVIAEGSGPLLDEARKLLSRLG